jgi:hypothetical protein
MELAMNASHEEHTVLGLVARVDRAWPPQAALASDALVDFASQPFALGVVGGH